MVNPRENDHPETPDVIGEFSRSQQEAGRQVLQDTLQERREKRKQQRRQAGRRRARIILPILAAVAAMGLYLLTPAANVQSIKVINNVFLSDEYVCQAAGISRSSKYLLVVPWFREISARQNPLIADLDVRKGAGHSVVLDVTETPIVGYRYDGAMELVLGDGTTMAFESGYISDLSLLPLFMDLPDSKLSAVAQAMAQLDDDLLMRIAEVRDFGLSFNADMVKFVMCDGYIVYVPISGIGLLKDYLQVITSTNSPYQCIYFDDENNVAVLRSCEELEQLYQQYLNPGASTEPEQGSGGDSGSAE